MSQINVDNIKNRTGGAIGAPSGIVVTGVSTFNGNVSVGGTLTYEDVTNIDSVGLITARKGIIATGVVTATSFSGSGANLTGVESGVSDFVASGDIPNGATVVINTDGTVGIVTRTASTDPDNPDVGTPVVFNSGTTQSMSSIYDSNSNKVVIAYRDGGNNNYGTAVIGTVTPTTNSISFGTPVVFNSSGRSDLGNGSVAYDSSNNKVVIAYKDHGNSNYGTAVVGTVSGTSISFGTPVVFESANNSDISATFDSNSNKVVIVYSDAGNSDHGTAIVGTVSGTSISFGTAVVFESASCSQISVTFDSSNNKVVIAYRDSGNSGHGTAIVGTVSGTSISFGSAVVFESSSVEYVSATFDSTGNKVVAAYRDSGNSGHGTAVVFDVITFLTNLTTENYIGMAAAGISSGATGKINIVSGINISQTGLTTGRTFYVQNSGGIDLAASSPSVVAGTAISGTKIIVKG